MYKNGIEKELFSYRINLGVRYVKDAYIGSTINNSKIGVLSMLL